MLTDDQCFAFLPSIDHLQINVVERYQCKVVFTSTYSGYTTKEAVDIDIELCCLLLLLTLLGRCCLYHSLIIIDRHIGL